MSKLKIFTVIALSVGGLGNKIFYSEDEVSENDFAPGRAEELVKEKFLEFKEEIDVEDGSEGDGSEGDGSEGDGSEGDGSEGDGSEGDGSEGDGSEGDDLDFPSLKVTEMRAYFETDEARSLMAVKGLEYSSSMKKEELVSLYSLLHDEEIV